jgi:hypothetical protein
VALDASVSTVLLELIDVADPLLDSSSVELRLGSGGGCFLAGGAGAGAGRLPGRISVTEPLTCSGGLFIVFCLMMTGRLAGIGGG